MNNNEACSHGRKDVGLPSQVARFSKTISAVSRQSRGWSGFSNMVQIGSEFHSPNDDLNVQVTEIKSLDAADPCHISLTSAAC